MSSSRILSEPQDSVRYHVNDRRSRRNLMEQQHRTPSGKNVLQSLSNYLFMAPKRYAYNVENTYPNGSRNTNAPRQRGVQRSVSLDRDDEIIPFPTTRQGSIRSSNRRHDAATTTASETTALPPTQVHVSNSNVAVRPPIRLHRSVGDLNLDSSYFDDISDNDDDDDDEIMPPSVFSRQYGAANSKSSAPVAPIVLQNLPTIIVRSEDLYCMPCATTDTTTDTASTNNKLPSTDCSICCEAVTLHGVAVRLPCSHMYHPTCIDTWLQQNHTCPICRCSLPTLADFTTPRSILVKRQEEKIAAAALETGGNELLRPMQFTKAEILGMTINDLKEIYTQWVTCTYHQTFLSLKIPDHVAEYNKESLMNYLVECHVIELILRNREP